MRHCYCEADSLVIASGAFFAPRGDPFFLCRPWQSMTMSNCTFICGLPRRLLCSLLAMTRMGITVTILVSLLIGCSARQQLGISELEWASYSKERKNFLVQSHKAITGERLLMKQKYVQQCESDDYGIIVEISGGKVIFPPDFIIWRNYRPLNFVVAVNQCRELSMISETDSNITTKIGVCFLGEVLYLDSSNYEDSKKFGSVAIHRSPLWKTGFEYGAIDSTGHVRFNGATVGIRQFDGEC